MKNILKPRINYSPLYHHVDDLQEQIFNTKNISSNPHANVNLLLNSLVHVIFLSPRFVSSKLYRIFALLCNSKMVGRPDNYG